MTFSQTTSTDQHSTAQVFNVLPFTNELYCLPSGYVNSLLLKMAIEIVDFPITNGDFP